MRMMLLAAALVASPALAADDMAPDFTGEYRLAEGPDVGGGLIIHKDGRFQYYLAAGALDERAEGRWEQHDDVFCLYTEPVPVPPAFEKTAPVEVEGAVPTIFVSWPNGRGIAGVTFQIGFDSGDPLDDYTQEDGWTMPEDDRRIPRWIELREPIYDVVAPRYELAAEDGGKLHARLIPNDMGVAAFNCAYLREAGGITTLYRPEGELRFRHVDDAE